MIDIRLVREQPELVRANLARRADKQILLRLEQLIEADARWRESLKQVEVLRAQKNDIEVEIAREKAAGKAAKMGIEKLKNVTQKIATLERQSDGYRRTAHSLLMRIPNLLHESVPVGQTEEENQEIRKWGKLPHFDFKPKGHEEIGLAVGGLELERAAKISGPGFIS